MTQILRVFRFIAAPSAAFLCLIVIIVFGSANPVQALQVFFSAPFSGVLFFGNMLNHASFLIIGALGFAIAFKAGIFNLGGEGQIYSGALSAAAVSTFWDMSNGSPIMGFIVIILCATAGMFTGAAMGALSGWFKAKWNTNDLISSFLLSSGVIHIINWLIAGPLKDPSSYLVTTVRLPEILRLPAILPPSHLSLVFFLAIVLAVASFVWLYKTAEGLKLRIIGKNPIFAEYGKIKTGRYIVGAFLLSGLFNGLTGSFVVLGQYYMCAYNCTSGLGWSAIAVALIARCNPLWVIPSAFFIAYMESALSGIIFFTGFPFKLGILLQAFVFFFITVRIFKGDTDSDRRYI